MKIVPAICTQCNGQIKVDSSQEAAVCEFCGTAFIVDKAIKNYYIQSNIQNNNYNIQNNIQNSKRGAVESVLGFIERKQAEEQRKKDEAKRKIDEAKRLEEEKKRQKAKKRKKNWKIYLLIIALLFVVGSVKSCSSERTAYDVKIPREI